MLFFQKDHDIVAERPVGKSSPHCSKSLQESDAVSTLCKGEGPQGG